MANQSMTDPPGPAWATAGAGFYRSAFAAARRGTTNMDTLIAIGATNYLGTRFWLAALMAASGQTVALLPFFAPGAAVWFPWIFATAVIVAGKGGAPVMGAGVNGWFITNLIYFYILYILLLKRSKFPGECL